MPPVILRISYPTVFSRPLTWILSSLSQTLSRVIFTNIQICFNMSQLEGGKKHPTQLTYPPSCSVLSLIVYIDDRYLFTCIPTLVRLTTFLPIFPSILLYSKLSMTSILPKVMDSSLFLFDILIASDESPTLSSLVSTSLKSQLSSYLPGDSSLSPFSLSNL